MGTHIVWFLLTPLLACSVISCDDGDCPTFELEVREFTGPSVVANDWSCTGELVDMGSCGPNPNNPFPLIARLDVLGCPDALIAFEWYTSAFQLSQVRVAFDIDGDVVVGARAHYESACDDDGCSLETEDPIGGWIMPELVVPVAGERNTGRFSIEFADGTFSGPTTRPTLLRGWARIQVARAVTNHVLEGLSGYLAKRHGGSFVRVALLIVSHRH